MTAPGGRLRLPRISESIAGLLASMKQSLLNHKPSLIEVLILVTVAATLLSILIPPVRWASSGSREVAVRISVFDAETGLPIEGARIELTTHSSPERSVSEGQWPRFPAGRDRDDSRNEGRKPSMGGTVAKSAKDGSARVHGTFPTSASHVHPEPHVDLSRGWIIVTSTGYGGAVIPVRHETLPTAVIGHGNEIPVSIGLFPCQ